MLSQKLIVRTNLDIYVFATKIKTEVKECVISIYFL